MAWPKGTPRPPGAGRKKGTPNKDKLGFMEKLQAFDNGKGFDPVYEALNLYTMIHADNPLVAVKILIAILDRVHPIPKPSDVTNQQTNLYMTMPYEELKQLVAKKLLSEPKNGQ